LFIHSFLVERPRVLHILEHLFHVRVDRCLIAVFPELHFGLLSIRV